MIDESLKKTLIVFGLLIVALSLVTLWFGFDSEVIGETPCVDGMNRINLEGIMCEDILNTWFGQHGSLSLLVLIPSLLGFFLIKLGMEGVI